MSLESSSLSTAVHKCCCSVCLPQASCLCIGLCCSPPSPFPESFGSVSTPWLMSICNSLSSFHQCFTLTLCGPCIPSLSQVLEASLELSAKKLSLTHPSSAFLKKNKYSISHFGGSISNFSASWRSALPHQQVPSF